MYRTKIQLLAALILLVLFCGPALARDLMIWQPRTPAGGARIADFDYYWLTLGLVSPSYTSQTIDAFPAQAVGTGYLVQDEDGRLQYFWNNGDPVDLNHYTVDQDPGGSGSFTIFRPDRSVTTVVERK